MKKESRSKLVSFLVGGLLVFLGFHLPCRWHWMVVTAQDTGREHIFIPTSCCGREPDLDAFAKQLSPVQGDTLWGFKNSPIISCGAPSSQPCFAILAAYDLARFRFGARGGLVLFFPLHITDASIHLAVLTSSYIIIIMFSKCTWQHALLLSWRMPRWA